MESSEIEAALVRRAGMLPEEREALEAVLQHISYVFQSVPSEQYSAQANQDSTYPKYPMLFS